MITDFLQNMLNLVASVPINLVIILIICLVLKLFGKTFKFILKIIIGYFLICFIFAVFGLTLPSIPAILNWLKEIGISIWEWGKSSGLF